MASKINIVNNETYFANHTTAPHQISLAYEARRLDASTSKMVPI
jgi:hypothetical protein